MSMRLIVLSVVTLACGVIVVGAGVLNSGAVRNAGCPHDLSELEGRWVLDHVRGELEAPPPKEIWFSVGSTPSLVRIADGIRSAEVAIEWPGRLVFAAGQQFDPLLPRGATVAEVMTHFCPPVPAWDHLIFYPDGHTNAGPKSRVIVYERE